MVHCVASLPRRQIYLHTQLVLIATQLDRSGRCFVSSITASECLVCEMFALIIIGMEGNSLWFCSARLGDVPKWVAMQIALAVAQRGAISPVAYSNTLLVQMTLDLLLFLIYRNVIKYEVTYEALMAYYTPYRATLKLCSSLESEKRK
ncbi:unnamed protein product [Danaus chrysippus]|uniref:(African queen) hypothetical protein n=1 Tax=Danaus chrysippus TaxID=151541 RepID=A0A8J2WBY1_9NEOP|nr:unnamed protein product [Danaus chrysippus]